MSISIERTREILETYNHFLEGLTLSSEYFYNPNENLTAPTTNRFSACPDSRYPRTTLWEPKAPDAAELR